MKYLSAIKNKKLSGKICLLRLDFNTEDNWRMEAVLPTIKFLMKKFRSVVILSHRGRPNHEVKKSLPAGRQEKSKVKSFSLKPQSEQLSRLLGKKVIFIKDFDFDEIKKRVFSAKKESVFLLENLRFLKGEEKNSVALAKQLASLGDIYVNDAFAVCHRANASVSAITGFIKSYAGFNIESEIKNLSSAIKKPKKPLIIILGGIKIKNKITVIKRLYKKADKFLIGGAVNRDILSLKNDKVIVPIDFKRAGDDSIRDIGDNTIAVFCNQIKGAGTIIWNGPLGDIDMKKFENGTKSVMNCVVGNKKAFKLIGGGETVMYFKKMGSDKKINFISTGGGAMLNFIAGKKMPGIKALK